MSKDTTQKLFEYISQLETVNEQLIITLKESVRLLTQFQSSVHDRAGWQEMLDTFNETIQVGERITGEKPTFH